VADVTLAATWDTAVAIATGAMAPHDAFTTGRLVVRGDIDVLRTQAPALAGLSHAFDEVREETTY
jgi:putative sterol carrier protein